MHLNEISWKPAYQHPLWKWDRFWDILERSSQDAETEKISRVSFRSCRHLLGRKIQTEVLILQHSGGPSSLVLSQTFYSLWLFTDASNCCFSSKLNSRAITHANKCCACGPDKTLECCRHDIKAYLQALQHRPGVLPHCKSNIWEAASFNNS